jgi:hypothetical protein
VLVNQAVKEARIQTGKVARTNSSVPANREKKIVPVPEVKMKVRMIVLVHLVTKAEIKATAIVEATGRNPRLPKKSFHSTMERFFYFIPHQKTPICL